MDIYWIKDKKKCGPATVPDVVSLLQMGEITPETKGWHIGVQGWKPLRELPALADFMSPAPSAQEDKPESPKTPEAPAPEQPARTQRIERPRQEEGAPEPAPATPYEQLQEKFKEEGLSPDGKVAIPAPYQRFLARLVDTVLYLAIGMSVLYAAGAPFDSAFSPANLFFWMPMILLEAYFLSTKGTTPGKKLMGIRIAAVGPYGPLTFGRALRRSLSVFILGMGMLILPIMVVTMAFSYFRARKDGICWWDFRAFTIPVSKQAPRPARIIVALGGIYFLVVLAGVFMQPWVVPMYQELSKTSPAAARILEPYVPAEALQQEKQAAKPKGEGNSAVLPPVGEVRD